MITRVRIKNYKSLKDVDVTLGPFTVLVRKNAAGKSTFIDAHKLVRDALRNGIVRVIAKKGGINCHPVCVGGDRRSH